MRDIATTIGMTAGSIYYHYPFKGDLLMAVYSEGVRRAVDAVERAVVRPATPWVRLERAVAAHLALMVGNDRDASPFAGVFVQVQPHDFPPEHHQALIGLRNAYEDLFRGLLQALPLRPATDRSLLRLQLIGAMNHVPHWYRSKGMATPAAVARAMIRHFRVALDPARA